MLNDTSSLNDTAQQYILFVWPDKALPCSPDDNVKREIRERYYNCLREREEVDLKKKEKCKCFNNSNRDCTTWYVVQNFLAMLKFKPLKIVFFFLP